MRTEVGDRAVTDDGGRAAAREVLRRRRRGSRATPFGQLVQDWYVGIFITATLLTMLFAATGSAILTPDCSASACLEPSGYRVVAAGLALVGVVGLFLGLRAAGPASSDPGTATWLLSSPADRSVLLRGTVIRAEGVALVAGGAWGVLVGFAFVGGSGGGAVVALPVITCAGAGLLCALLLLPLGLRLQGGHLGPASSLRAVTDAELARAGRAVEAVGAATLMLDTAALDSLATRRRLGRRGRYRSRPGAGGALTSILTHELRALTRRGGRVVIGLAGCVGALVAGLLLGRFVGTLLAALAVLVLTKSAAGGLTTWVTTPGLRRSVPIAPARVTAVLGAAPLVLGLLGSVVALVPLGLPWWGPVLLATGSAAGALRSCDPPPDLGVALSTPAGAVHVGLVQRLVQGADLAVLGALVLLLAEAHDLGAGVVVVGVGLLVWQVARERP